MNPAITHDLLPFEILSAASLLLLLIISFYRKETFCFFYTLAALAGSCAVMLWHTARNQQSNFIAVDGLAAFYFALITGCIGVVSILAHERETKLREEFYVLVLLGGVGATLLASSINLISAFAAVEILSVSLYGLIAFDRSYRAIEAGLKYLVMGGFASAFMLMGIAVLYYDTGALGFAELRPHLVSSMNMTRLAGIVLIITGVGFKLALVPFNMWIPDVYAGTRAYTGALLATVSKAAVVALLVRLAVELRIAENAAMGKVLTAIAVITMLAGSALALFEINIKKLLAYSSIANVGYILVAIIAGTQDIAAVTNFYVLIYSMTVLCAFGVVSIKAETGEAVRITNLRSLAYNSPAAAVILTISMLSLAGLPITGGFMSKFYVLLTGIRNSHWMLSIVLIISSAAGIYYYLKVLNEVFARPDGIAAERGKENQYAGMAVLGAVSLGIVVLGIYPGPVVEILSSFVTGAGTSF